MKVKLLILGLALLCFATYASASSFSQCPAVGNDTSGCELLITVTAVNSAGAATAFTVTTASPDQGPFDGVEDTLIGIQNNSGSTLTAVTVTGPAGTFGFDGDGACSGGYSLEPTLTQCGLTAYTFSDPSDYESAGATFSNINLNQSTGTINVDLANGASTWFDLEGHIGASQITPSGPTVTPEPTTLLLFGTGLAALATRLRKKLS